MARKTSTTPSRSKLSGRQAPAPSGSAKARASLVDGELDWQRQLDFGFDLIDAQSVGSLAAAIVEPILGTVTPVYEYAPHTWGPDEADRLASDIGGWHNPEAL